MNAEHEHVTVNLPPPYYTHSTADTWHPTLVPKNSWFPVSSFDNKDNTPYQ